MGFPRLVRFDGTAAILVFKSERDLGKVSKLTPTPAPLDSLDTFPRLRSLLQIKMAAVPSKSISLENPTEKEGTVNSLKTQPFHAYFESIDAFYCGRKRQMMD